jgi:hypothetical protein
MDDNHCKSDDEKSDNKKSEDEKSEDEKSEDCSICLDSLTLPFSVLTLKCKHQFHTKCISRVFNLCCPVCRADINTGDIDDEVYEMMLKNKDRVRDDFEREDRNEIIRNIRDTYTLRNMGIADQTRIACRYLARCGIACKYYPTEMNIHIKPGEEDIETAFIGLPDGYYFNAVVQSVVFNIQNTLEVSEENDDDGEEQEEVSYLDEYNLSIFVVIE